jgi:hypothetical protein
MKLVFSMLFLNFGAEIGQEEQEGKEHEANPKSLNNYLTAIREGFHILYLSFIPTAQAELRKF